MSRNWILGWRERTGPAAYRRQPCATETIPLIRSACRTTIPLHALIFVPEVGVGILAQRPQHKHQFIAVRRSPAQLQNFVHHRNQQTVLIIDPLDSGRHRF